MMIKDLFLGNYSTQAIIIWISCVTLIFLLFFYTWKFISKQIINYKRLNLLDERLSSANSNCIEADSGILKATAVEINEETDPIEEAKIFATYGKFDQAITILQWQISAFPNEIISYSELFVIYIHLEDESEYLKLIKLLPYDWDSAEFQGALANGLLSFPDSEELNNLSEQHKAQNKKVRYQDSLCNIEKEKGTCAKIKSEVLSHEARSSETQSSQNSILKKQANISRGGNHHVNG